MLGVLLRPASPVLNQRIRIRGWMKGHRRIRRPGNASRAFCESRVTSFFSTVLSQFYKVNITPAAENVKEKTLCRITKNGPNRAAKICFMFERCLITAPKCSAGSAWPFRRPRRSSAGRGAAPSRAPRAFGASFCLSL